MRVEKKNISFLFLNFVLLLLLLSGALSVFGCAPKTPDNGPTPAVSPALAKLVEEVRSEDFREKISGLQQASAGVSEEDIEQPILKKLLEKKREKINTPEKSVSKATEITLSSDEMNDAERYAFCELLKDSSSGLELNIDDSQSFAEGIRFCLNTFVEPVVAHTHAIELFNLAIVDSKEIPEPDQSWVELDAWRKKQEIAVPEYFSLKKSDQLRKTYSDSDINTLLRLAGRRRVAAQLAGEHTASLLRRYEAPLKLLNMPYFNNLLLLVRHSTAKDKKEIFSFMQQTSPSLMQIEDIFYYEDFPWQTVFPYSLLSHYYLPDAPLHVDMFGKLLSLVARDVQLAYTLLDATPKDVNNRIELYKKARDLGNVPIPESDYHPVPNAVRVAFLDSGVDYKSFSYQLGSFLAPTNDPNSENRLQSYDYADDDPFPYAPKERFGSNHGTSVMGDFVYTTSNHSFLFEEQKLDLAMWKVYTDREILGGFYPLSLNNWFETRHSIADALIDQVNNKKVFPHILSVSMVFPLWNFLKASFHPLIISAAKWLWIMAAGNSSEDVSVSQNACLRDFPALVRPRKKILCVAATQPGYLQDQQAVYTNFGDDVDIYTEETTGRHACPSGTSCAVPGMTFAAAKILAENPELTPEELRMVIIESARERWIPKPGANIDNPETRKKIEAHDPAYARKVRYFNPTDSDKYQDMPRALKRAAEVVKNKKLRAV